MITPINKEFRSAVNEHIKNEWSGPLVVTKGTVHDTSNAEGFISVTDGVLTGYILYRIDKTECEILVLQSLRENCGIGTALMNTVMSEAKENHCIRVWLITTNDNIHAIRYYQRAGFDLTALYLNAMEQTRKIKPSIPLLGNENIPLKHELEFSFLLKESFSCEH